MTSTGYWQFCSKKSNFKSSKLVIINFWNLLITNLTLVTQSDLKWKIWPKLILNWPKSTSLLKLFEIKKMDKNSMYANTVIWPLCGVYFFGCDKTPWMNSEEVCKRLNGNDICYAQLVIINDRKKEVHQASVESRRVESSRVRLWVRLCSD